MLVCWALVWSQAVWAQPIAPEQIPEPLKTWVPWVLYNQAAQRCSFLHQGGERYCAWPSPLELTLQNTGGSFQQTWMLEAAAWIPLPGNEQAWPQQVTVNGSATAVTWHEGVPSLYINDTGRYTVSGSFAWSRLPEALPTPAEVGLLSLQVNGEAVPFPKREPDGRLWLQHEATTASEENRLELRVQRHVSDEIPLILTTLIDLEVSGHNREVLLGKALMDGFVPMAISSALPVRLDPDGRVRVQVRPGEWQISITARHHGPVASIARHDPGEPWAQEEIWVFAAQNQLRLIEVGGVTLIDPQQTTLPEGWKQLPAYLVHVGDAMQLTEHRRGDTDPAPDQLSLSRQLWLDFNGGGYTLRDQVTGTMQRQWRLEVNPPLVLGRAAVDGAPQLITRIADQERMGIEIRQGTVNAEADSRIESGGRRIPAVGWNQDFQSVHATLHLPPGWRLLAALGVDDAPQAWWNRWTLLDIFLVLIVALAFWKLWGPRWGGLALLVLILTVLEPKAPRWIWLVLLAGQALLRVLIKGQLQRLLKIYHVIVVAALLLAVIPFAVRQIRHTMHPTLEHPYWDIDSVAREINDNLATGAASPHPEEMRDKGEETPGMGGAVDRAMKMAPPTPPSVAQSTSQNYQSYGRKKLAQQEPGAKVQTGPGLPNWQWNQMALHWSGPVTRDQSLRLCLLSPRLHFAIAVLAILLLGVLVGRGVCFGTIPWPQRVSGSMKKLGLVGLLLMCSVPAAFAGDVDDEVPSETILQELATRLLAPPPCFPDCAALARMHVEADAQVLRLRITAATQTATAIPIPGSAKGWRPQRILVDHEVLATARQTDDGRLWLELPAGVHELLLEGALPAFDTVSIPLPLRPYAVTAHVEGWTLDGVNETGGVAESLQLLRAQRTTGASATTQTVGELPAFVRVVRRLLLDLTWEVETIVERLSPIGTAIVLDVPLIAGESVTTAEIPVKDRQVRVNMGPQATSFSWRSNLEPAETISLQSPETLDWVEIWQLELSPIWHAEFSGIPMIHQEASTHWTPQWQPWPGEAVTAQISRPSAVSGQTRTIDRVSWTLSPGLRATDVQLEFNLRSSLGGQHVVTLPEASELQSVAIDGSTQPIRQDAVSHTVTLPIRPGAQQFTLNWRQADGIRWSYRPPAIDLGLPSVNADIKLQMPRGRWILFACGPRLGPAVVFWSYLVVLVLIALAFSRVTWVPLRTWQWLLLGIGLSQVPAIAALVVAAWFLALAWRARRPATQGSVFDLQQLLLVGWTVVTFAIFCVAIYQGLLGTPDMQIAGNGSDHGFLRWFQDRSDAQLSQPWVLSVPIFVYRVAMLAWALWIALSLLHWLKWGWQCFSSGGYWRPFFPPRTVVAKR